MKRFITAVVCLMAVAVAGAQFTQPGFYRVHNVGSDRYICIKGTKYNKTSNPDAFWPCIKMLNDSAQISDAGSIVYIPEMGQTSLCAQGVSTFSLTGLFLEIDTATVREGGKPTYVAKTQYGTFPCIFRDYGNGLTAGFLEKPESRWWVEPVNAGSIDTSFLGIMPVNEAVADANGFYWATLCCDFTFVLPEEGGIVGAYTVKEITTGEDGLYYAQAVKVYGQGDTVPAATPVLLKCKAGYASGNKIIPAVPIANRTSMPIVNDLLMGNYFSNFINHAHLTSYDVTAEYVPDQATMATDDYLALGVDADGKLGFFPKAEGTYMDANSAWLAPALMAKEQGAMTAVYLAEVEDEEPGDPEEPVIILGDANGDGMVSIKDVTLLINYLMRENNDTEEPARFNAPSTVNVAALDVNEDGIVNIKDVTTLINLLLASA